MSEAIKTMQNALTCGHCSCKFQGVDWQVKKVKYEQRVVYCSEICSKAARSKMAREQALREGRKLRKGVLSGPCKHCGKMFESRIDKMYCSMDCYIKSDQFREIQSRYWEPSAEAKAKIAEKLRKGENVPCLECGNEFYQKRESKTHKARKFCCISCYRSYFAKRFDRWVANPEEIALPQCYDEFLDREQLKCVVDGCNWTGQNLSLHMNQAHGVKADEFKRAAGFNLGTGVVAKPLAQALRERELRGVAANLDDDFRASFNQLALEAMAAKPIIYRSLEGIEHKKKARALTIGGPERVCACCEKKFFQSTPFGKTLFCSIECREKVYAPKRQEKKRQIRRGS